MLYIYFRQSDYVTWRCVETMNKDTARMVWQALADAGYKMESGKP